jgi:hypothetical protein
LSRGSYQLTDAEHGVLFKIDPVAQPVQLGWTAAGTEQAFLWLDRNGNGTVDDGGELFGNYTLLQNGTRAPNGFEALREFDQNADGVIDENDPVWTELQLWIDRNHNGISEPDEVSFVKDSEIGSISLTDHWTGRRDQFGNLFRYESSMVVKDGSAKARTRPVYDIYFVRGTP